MLSFKSAISLCSFTFIKRLFSSSYISAIRVVSSAYLKLLIRLLNHDDVDGDDGGDDGDEGDGDVMVMVMLRVMMVMVMLVMMGSISSHPPAPSPEFSFLHRCCPCSTDPTIPLLSTYSGFRCHHNP